MSDTSADIPSDTSGVIIFTFILVSFAALISILCMCCCKRPYQPQERRRGAQSDQNRVYNISSHVQSQNQTQYPDGYLSVEHITITNELNKPPKYDDAPPTYEEAVKLAMARSNSMQTFQAEQQQNHEQPQTSSSATAPAMVHAVPHRTTE